MTDDRGVVRAIDWRGLFPWLVIFRTFGPAVSWPLLVLATAGVLLTPLGWRASTLLFVSQESLNNDPGFRTFVEFNNRWPGQVAARFEVPAGVDLPEPANRALITRSGDTETVYQRLVLPFQQLFSRQWSIGKFAYFLFGGLWTLLVWSYCGGAITRIAAMRLGREERVGFVEALWFALKKLGACFTAPLFPLGAVFLLAAFVAVPSLLMRLDFGVLLAGLAWPLALLAGFLMTLLLLGLLFGWPLMTCTISVEGTDPFDALARAYAYVFQRPLQFLFYGLVAALFGALGYALVLLFTETMIYLAFWGASWGAGSARIDEIAAVMNGAPVLPSSDPLEGPREPGRLFWLGAGLLNLSVGLVRSVATAFSYSFFWCLATALYLLLRHDVDQTEFDEVYLEDADEPYGLPPLKPDRHGVPTVPPPLPGTATKDKSGPAKREEREEDASPPPGTSNSPSPTEVSDGE